MGTKISDLNELLAPDAADVLAIVDVSANETKKTTVANLLAAGGGGGASYLVYTALLTQAGTDAPVATVLENTLGGAVVWTRNGVGDYTATLAGAFTVDKTFGIAGTRFNLTQALLTSIVANVSANYVTLQTQFQMADGGNAGFADGILSKTFVEIRVYP